MTLFKFFSLTLIGLSSAASCAIAPLPTVSVPVTNAQAAQTVAEPAARMPPVAPAVVNEGHPVSALALNAVIAPLPAPSQPAPTTPPASLAPLAVPLPNAPTPTRADVEALSEQMHAALGGALLADAPALTHMALAAAHASMQRAFVGLDRMQVVLVVDRSPKVQRLWVTIATPGTNALEALGSVHVSTGKPGRKEHFRTPVGVFRNDASILGYRALGTYNENHIRGIGLRGMRVWDFGWQTTDDWRTPRALMAVRMEMHATDPAVLEPRLGRWDSEGCIRIPTRFNSFLDLTGLIDAKERKAALGDRRFAALLLKDATPSPLAGEMLVVVDTSQPDAAPSDPKRAQVIAHPAVSGPEHDDAS